MWPGASLIAARLASGASSDRLMLLGSRGGPAMAPGRRPPGFGRIIWVLELVAH
jgi:hypothetical protein